MPTRLLLEGADVEELLARVRTEHGPDARIVKAERVRSGGVGGFFARERFEVTVEMATEPEVAISPQAAAEPAPATVEDLLDAADASERAAEPVVRAWSPPRAVPSGRRPLSTDGPDFAEVLAALTATAEQERRPHPTPSPAAPAPPPAAPVPPPAAPVPPTSAESTHIAALSRLGVPDQILVHIGPGDVVAQLHRALRRLPAAPRPRLPRGGVVAVVGSRRPAMRCAATLAERLRVDPSSVLHAGGHDAPVPARRRLAGADEARRRAAWARAKELPVVVVVEAEADPEDHLWARELLESLAPEQIWAVVDATRKTQDTRGHLRALAGQTGVDALAVYGAAATGDPASVLGLGSPVGFLDGTPATAGTWTALLVDRLEGNG